MGKSTILKNYQKGDSMKKTKKSQRIKDIEYHLRNYHTYKVGIKNLTNQLNYIMPNVTANFELMEGSAGTFSISSNTEKYAIDRIESRKALDLHEDIKRYELIIKSIDEALKGLEETERDFIRYRYIEGMTIAKTSLKLGYSEQHIFNIRNHAFNKLLISLRGILEL